MNFVSGSREHVNLPEIAAADAAEKNAN